MDAINEVLSPHSQKKLKYGTFRISDVFNTEEVSKHVFCLCLNCTFTDAVKNFIKVLYVDQAFHLKCLEVQCTG